MAQTQILMLQPDAICKQNATAVGAPHRPRFQRSTRPSSGGEERGRNKGRGREREERGRDWGLGKRRKRKAGKLKQGRRLAKAGPVTCTGIIDYAYLAIPATHAPLKRLQDGLLKMNNKKPSRKQRQRKHQIQIELQYRPIYPPVGCMSTMTFGPL